jgi:hypothetical protein
MKKLYILIILLFPFLGSAQKIYVDAANTTGVENGTKQHPFNTVAEGISASAPEDTVMILNGTYSLVNNRTYLKPGIFLIGQNKENTIIKGDIIDSTRLNLPNEIQNLTFRSYNYSPGRLFNMSFDKPNVIRNCICHSISVSHGDGYLNDTTLAPIPFFTIENNTVETSIGFSHGGGIIVGENNIRNNTCEFIGLSCGPVDEIVGQNRPEYSYLINNNITGGIGFSQGESKKLSTKIIVANNTVGGIGMSSGRGFTYLIHDNIIESGISDASKACWTTISNNSIKNGGYSDKSGGFDDGKEDHIVENNTFYIDNTGNDEPALVFSVKSTSITIRNNKIYTAGKCSGMVLSSGSPTNVIGNEIHLDPVFNSEAGTAGIYTSAGKGLIKDNIIEGAYYGYFSNSGATEFSGNKISGSHHGFLSSGNEEVFNNVIKNCTGHGLIVYANRGPIHNNIITDNDSAGVYYYPAGIDMGGGKDNSPGRNIIRNNGWYDLVVAGGKQTPDTVYIRKNVWDHQSLDEIIRYDILNLSPAQVVVKADSFIIPPDVPVLSTPGHATSGTETKISFTWESAANAESYYFQLSESDNFNAVWSEKDSIETLNYTVDGLHPNTTYYWHVQAANLAGKSSWSETRQFSTLITGIHENALEKERVRVYPNPTTGKFKVQGLKFKVEGVEVIDLNGRILERFNQLPESDCQDFDISHLNPGVYFVRLGYENQTEINKIVKK